MICDTCAKDLEPEESENYLIAPVVCKDCNYDLNRSSLFVQKEKVFDEGDIIFLESEKGNILRWRVKKVHKDYTTLEAQFFASYSDEVVEDVEITMSTTDLTWALQQGLIWKADHEQKARWLVPNRYENLDMGKQIREGF